MSNSLVLEIMSNRFGKNMDKWYFSHKEKTNIALKIKAWEIYGLILWVRKAGMLLWFRKKLEYFYDL